MSYNYLSPEENETYKEYIQRILSSRDNIFDKENYQERHHILPKCMGGTNDNDNLIYLYGEEHYYAHKLLALENPKHRGLQTAWWNMCHCCGSAKSRIMEIVTAEDYAEARERHRQNISGENNHNYGGMSDLAKQRMSENHADVSGANNPRARKVRCIETGEVFNTAKDAGVFYNLTPSNPGCSIRDCCRGKKWNHTAGKDKVTGEPLHWEWVD